MLIKHREYFTYIVTNQNRNVLYVGVTNDLPKRIAEHYFNSGRASSFAGKYNCHYLLYFKSFKYINDAIAFEKRIKGWSRKKKDELIVSVNPGWESLNANIMAWPPKEELLEGRQTMYEY